MTPSVVSVSGYGWTGASAVVDLLRGYREFGEFGTEFRLIKDPDGVVDLENALVDDWTHIKCHVALRRFERLAHRLARPWYLGGEDYEALTSDEFRRLTRNYVEDLVEFTYEGGNTYLSLQEPLWRRYLGYGWRKLGGSRRDNELYYSMPEDEFLEATRRYLSGIADAAVHDDVEYMVLDQAIHPLQCKRSLRYFDDAKMVLVDRDARDVYLDSLGTRFVPDDDVDDFIRHYRAMRSKAEENADNPDVLKVQFEDLVTQPDSVGREILEFLTGDADLYRGTGDRFHPEESIQNTGMYETHGGNSEELRRIEQELDTYLYTG